MQPVRINRDAIEAVKEIGAWILESGMAGIKVEEINPGDTAAKQENARKRNAAAAAQANVIALAAYETGRGILDIVSEYHIVDGKLSKKPEAMLADFQRAGGKWVWTESSPTRAAIRLSINGVDDEVDYAIEDAKIAGLLNGRNSNWQIRPDAMLRARCVGKAMRMYCPIASAGKYTPDELEEVAERDALPVPPDRPLLSAPAPTPAPALPEPDTDPVPFDASIIPPPRRAAVTDYLLSKGLIRSGETWIDASPVLMERIRKNPDGLIKIALEHAAASAPKE